MTIRGETAIKDLFTTGAIPTQQNYHDWIESVALAGDAKGLVPLKKFGLSMQDYTATDVDQLTAFQAAIDSAAGSGDIVVLPGGKLVLAGELQLPVLGGMIGASYYHTHVKLADDTCTGSTSVSLMTCNAPLTTSTGHTSGSIANIVKGIFFNGNGQNNTYANKEHPLLAFRTGNTGVSLIDGPQSILGHNRNFVDPRRLVRDIFISDSPGSFLQAQGRGETRWENIFAQYCEGNGFDMQTFDEWWTNCTSASTGGIGFAFGAGCAQNRMVALKAFFNGYDVTRTDGCGFKAVAGGFANSQLIGCTAQDTWAHGFDLQGQKITMTGCMSESIGSLYQEFGFGNPDESSMTGIRAAIRLSNAKNCDLQLMHSDRQVANGSTTTAKTAVLVDIRSNSTKNVVDISYGTENGAPESLAEVRANNLTKGGSNYVKVNGRETYGWGWTAAQLGDAAEGVNTVKFEGRRVYDTTNDKPLWASGSAATATWKDATGTVAITPA